MTAEEILKKHQAQHPIILTSCAILAMQEYSDQQNGALIAERDRYKKALEEMLSEIPPNPRFALTHVFKTLITEALTTK